MEPEVAANLFKNANDLWVQPEINKRTADGSLPKNFKIYQCLIKFPQECDAIVEFNNEIAFIAEFEAAPGENIQVGDDVFLHQVQKIKNVSPPEVDSKRVAFIYIYWQGSQYAMAFDFTPNSSVNIIYENKESDWEIGKVIGESMHDNLKERAINIQGNISGLFRKVGLWAVPSLIPFPITKMAVELDKGNPQEAVKILVSFCDEVFLRNTISKWYTHSVFLQRQLLIEEAYFAHVSGKYALSVNALLPQVEGIITDWMYENMPDVVPWRQESKMKMFRDFILSRVNSSFLFKSVVESTFEFMLEGPVLETFKKWEQEVDNAFPNRNAISHGKYIGDIYCVENSIKIFLLLDSISYII